MFSNTEDLLPVISFNAKTSTDDQRKHDDFVNRMMEKGYTKNKSDSCLSGIYGFVNPLNLRSLKTRLWCCQSLRWGLGGAYGELYR